MREVARLASLGLPQAGAWLPIATLGNHLRGHCVPLLPPVRHGEALALSVAP